jgi:hypothetical protein
MSDDEEKKRKLPPRDPAKVCGAGTPPCQQWKGFRTSHPGIGSCWVHGGATANHQVAADRAMVEQRMRTFGNPIEKDPLNALLEEVHRSAGHVAWLQDLVGELEHGGAGYKKTTNDEGEMVFTPLSGLTQLDRSGKFEKASVWVELYQNERQHLARVCKMALDAGVDERRINLIERQATAVVELVKGVLDDFNLTEEQLAMKNEILTRRFGQLRVLQGGKTA